MSRNSCSLLVGMQDGPATSEESLFLTKLPLPYDSAIMLFFCLLKGVENLGPQTQEERNGNPLQYSCLENPMDCSLPGSSVHRISQARVLEWGAIAFSLMDSRHPETDMVLGMASLCSWGNPWRRLLTASTSLKGAWWHNIMSTVQSKFPMTAHVQIEPWWLFTRKPEEKSLHWDQLLVFFKTPSFQLYFFLCHQKSKWLDLVVFNLASLTSEWKWNSLSLVEIWHSKWKKKHKTLCWTYLLL